MVKLSQFLPLGDSRLRSRSSRKQHEHGGQKLTRLVASGTLILIGFLVIGLYVGGEAGFVDLNPSSQADSVSALPLHSAAASSLASELLGNEDQAEASSTTSSTPVSSLPQTPVVALLAALTPTPPAAAAFPPTATPPPTATSIPPTVTPAPTATPVPPTATPDSNPGSSNRHARTHDNPGSSHRHARTHGNPGSSHRHARTHGNAGSSDSHSPSWAPLWRRNVLRFAWLTNGLHPS